MLMCARVDPDPVTSQIGRAGYYRVSMHNDFTVIGVVAAVALIPVAGFFATGTSAKIPVGAAKLLRKVDRCFFPC